MEHWPQPLETGHKPLNLAQRIEFFSRFHPSLQANNLIGNQDLVLLPGGVHEKGHDSKITSL